MIDQSYSFYSYSRRGAAARITGSVVPDSGRAEPSVTVSIQRLGAVTVGPEPAASPGLPVLGPADVLGTHEAQVLRRAPVPDDHDAEPNYLAAIEFRHPDLPWLFTPRGPDAIGAAGDGRLPPWIALVVVPDPNGDRVRPMPGSPNPVLDASDSELPNPDETWAWAHVQVLAPDGAADGLLRDPGAFGGAVRSRLLCPRHLEPNVSYVACVVPTFAEGRLVGLDQPVTRVEDRKAAAWAAGQGPVRLPVFHHWRFRTGPSGDFESLARKLRPVRVTDLPSIGERVVLIDPVLSRLERERAGHFAPMILQIPTAVTVPDTAAAQHGQPGQPPGPLNPASTTPAPARDEINARLTAILDRPEQLRRAGDPKPTVGPPIYGQWHAQVRSIADAPAPIDGTPAIGATPGWIRELNLDPESRASAGVGTTVVQHDQEALMASAWEQLEAVVRANQLARWGKLFQAASGSMHVRRIEPRVGVDALRLANPALARLRETAGIDPGPTVAARIAAAPVPDVVFGATFARVSRFAGRSAGRIATNEVLNGIAPGLLEGTQRLRTRYDGGAKRLAPAEFGDLLKRAGIEEEVTALTGHPIDEQIDHLVNLPALIERVATEVVIPEHDVGQLIPDRVALQPDDAAAGPGGQVEIAGGVVDAVNDASHVGVVDAVNDASHVGVVDAVNDASHVGIVDAVNDASHVGIVDAVAGSPVMVSRIGITSGISILGGSAIAGHHVGALAVPTAAFPALVGVGFGPPGPAALALAPASDPSLAIRISGTELASFRDLAAAAAPVLAEPGMAGPAEVQAEIAELLAQPDDAEVTVSMATASRINGLVAAGLIADGGQAATLVSGQVTVANPHVFAFETMGLAASLGAHQVQATLQVSAAQSTLLQLGFGISQPIVPALLVGLPAEAIGRITGEIDAIMPMVALPDVLREPPPVRPIAAADARRIVVERLEPVANFERMLGWLVAIDPKRARRRKASDEVLAAPVFDDPFLDRIRQIDQEWILGGSATIPPNSLLLMGDNRRFVEGVLAGANHEMARELLWRGYPTDQRGTPFARFWPASGGPSGAVTNDIAPMPDWANGLGLNPPDLAAPTDMTVLVVKGELLRRYPRTIVSAVAGKATGDAGDPRFIPGASQPVRERFRFALQPDLTCVGLGIAPDTLKAAPPGAPDEEWFIALTQPIEEPRFGLDETFEPDLHLDDDDLAWPMPEIDATVRDRHLRFLGDIPTAWSVGDATAAVVADALFQRPFQLLLRAAEYLP